MTTTLVKDTNQLPDLLKLKSREAFESLYDNFSPALYGVICKMVQNTGTGEELLQDVFVKIWKNIDRYDASRGTLFTWMLNITRNTCIDYLRSSRHKMQMQLNGAPLESISVGAELNYNPENSELRGLALKLEHKYRQIIDLVYFWGYSQEEVSQMLNIPLGTVKTRSRNGLQELRKLYQNFNNNS
ncbi:MAG TPA: RNA polymerase sigma factor [Panacibacter sp.]|nr:RNA polymerase sigma factor [Panacibacter sp.]